MSRPQQSGTHKSSWEKRRERRRHQKEFHVLDVEPLLRVIHLGQSEDVGLLPVSAELGSAVPVILNHRIVVKSFDTKNPATGRHYPREFGKSARQFEVMQHSRAKSRGKRS